MFGGGGGGDDGGGTVRVTGSVYIDPSITESGDVIVGFIDEDPSYYEGFSGPVEWANFQGSSQYLGNFTRAFTFDFPDVPEGNYFMIAIIDTNYNGKLDLDYGEPLEPVGAWPVDENDEPYLWNFDTDQSNVEIVICWMEGFYEDFEDRVANNWYPVSGDWSIARWDDYQGYYYNMQSTGSGQYASSYYDEWFTVNEFYYSADVWLIATGEVNEYGIFFLSQNISIYNNYSLSVDGNGNWYLKKWQDGIENTLAWGDNIGVSSKYYLYVEYYDYDGYFYIYIYNYATGESIDYEIFNEYTSNQGYVGLFGLDYGSECGFDNISFYGY